MQVQKALPWKFKDVGNLVCSKIFENYKGLRKLLSLSSQRWGKHQYVTGYYSNGQETGEGVRREGSQTMTVHPRTTPLGQFPQIIPTDLPRTVLNFLGRSSV